MRRRGKREKKDLGHEHTVEGCGSAEVKVVTDVICPSSSAAPTSPLSFWCFSSGSLIYSAPRLPFELICHFMLCPLRFFLNFFYLFYLVSTVCTRCSLVL